MKARYLAAVAAALWGTSALGASVTCPDPTIAGLNYMTLTTDTITATCYDYGTTGDNTGNPILDTSGSAVVFDNKTVELPAGTDTTDVFGTFLSGSTSGSTSGTFDVIADGTGTWYLLFKFGSGAPGDLWWFVYALDSLVSGEEIGWSTTGQQALSHAELFGGTASTTTTTTTTTTSGDVPEPGTLTLMGLGLVGLGFARRFKKKAA